MTHITTLEKAVDTMVHALTTAYPRLDKKVVANIPKHILKNKMLSEETLEDLVTTSRKFRT